MFDPFWFQVAVIAILVTQGWFNYRTIQTEQEVNRLSRSSLAVAEQLLEFIKLQRQFNDKAENAIVSLQSENTKKMVRAILGDDEK